MLQTGHCQAAYDVVYSRCSASRCMSAGRLWIETQSNKQRNAMQEKGADLKSASFCCLERNAH